MLVQDLFENRMHDAYTVFQQLAAAVNQSKDIDLQVGREMMPIAYWQARHLLGKYKAIAKHQGPDAGMAFLGDYNAINDALDAMDAKLASYKNTGSVPGQRSVEETHDYDDGPEECWTCRGTGEGQWDGASCHSCGGSGFLKPKRNDDDFDIPDDDDMYEGEEHSPAASAITRRILTQRADLLSKYGPVLVTQAIDEVADFVGDVEEIGSSDVSGWVRQVEQMLANNPPEAFGEGELNTSRMNKQSQDFYNKNPNFKRSDRETKSLGNNRLATRVGPAGGLPKVAKKAMTPFKSMAKEDARPGPLERTAPHIQKKTSDQIAHLNALNGLEETVSLLKAANRRVTENLSLMSEAGSPAQQAAIAIAMKKAGKKPKGVREDYKPSMKMADYMAQADRLHDEMMRCQHAGDEAGYERAKQKYVELEKQAKQGMVPEGERNFKGANGPVSVTTTPGGTVVKRKSWDSGAGGSSSDRVEFRDPNSEYFNNTRNSDYDSGDYSNDPESAADWPFQEINELSNEKLTQYKHAAAADAGKADLAGDYKRGDKRFGGIIKATKKQFANDIKKHKPQ